jgi:3-methylcrotonyl-CoA carboxylase beta subunit
VISTLPPSLESQSSALHSNIDTSSPDYLENVKHMKGLISELDDLFVKKIQPGGPEKARKKHVESGKLLPRDRSVR